MKPSTLITIGFTMVLSALAVTIAAPPHDIAVVLYFILIIGGIVLIVRGRNS